MKHPVIDLHCDLLAHMLNMPTPDPFDKEGIGCSFPALAAGNIKLQVMAIFTATEKGSTLLAVKQSEIFASFLAQYPDDCTLVHDVSTLNQIASSSKLGMIAAIENASSFCEEDEPLAIGLERLEQIITNTTRILYIGLTHHTENRFGGGNNSDVGLKDDGKTLLQYLSGRKIAVDFSHASDALAQDILDYLSEHNLDVPILASHSNYRKVFNHVRNLPDDLAKKIIQEGGIIGLNFLRAFVNNEDPNALYQHVNHGIELLPLGLEDHVVIVVPLNGAIGGDAHDIQLIDVPKLLCFCFRCTGHARKLVVHAEVVLERDGRIGLGRSLDSHTLLGLDGLVQTI